jgi:hypothetical protein
VTGAFREDEKLSDASPFAAERGAAEHRHSAATICSGTRKATASQRPDRAVENRVYCDSSLRASSQDTVQNTQFLQLKQ